jgi:[ribosomal protein S5]-alanine N-acetyltransferase
MVDLVLCGLKPALQLRQLKASDQKALAAAANNKKIWDNVRDAMPHPYSENDAMAFIKFVKSENPNNILAIVYENEFAGMIGLHPQKDVYRLSAELGYWIAEPFWGKGIATAAVQMMLQHGFETLKLNRIYAGIFEHNLASMRVLEKCGFEKEGISRQAIVKNNMVLDEHRFAIFP